MLSRRLDYTITGRDLSKGAFASVQNSVSKTEKGLKSVTATAGRVNAAFAGVTLAGFGAGTALNDLGKLETQMIRLRGVSKNFASDQKFLETTSRDLGLRFSDLAESFASLSVLENVGFLDAGQAQGLSVGFEQAAKKFGVAGGDIQLAVKGVRQALSQRVVRAQEFDQIFDSISAVMPLVARELGITQEEFFKMRTSASLLSSDLVAALIPAMNSLDGSAQSASASIQGGFRKAATSYENLLLAFQKPISGGFQDFTDGLSSSLDLIANNADLIGTSFEFAGTALLTAFGGRAIGALATFASTQNNAISVSRAHNAALLQNEQFTISNAAAQRASVTQLAQASAARFDLAKANAASLASQKQQLQQEVALTKTTAARAPLLNRIKNISLQQRDAAIAVKDASIANRIAQEKLNTTYATANKRVLTLTTRMRVAAIASRALALSTTALNGAMSLVGGPAGVAAIGIGSLILKYREATKVTRELGNAIEDAERATATGDTAALADIERVRLQTVQKINDLRFEESKLVKDIIKNGNEITGPGESTEIRLTVVRQEVAKLKADLKTLEINSTLDTDISAFSSGLANANSIVTSIKANLATVQVKDDLFGKIFPKDEQIKKLQTLRDELSALNSSGSLTSGEYERANSALQEQINKLNGVTEARTKAAASQAKQLESLKELRLGVLDEVGRLRAEFSDQESAVIEIQTRLGDKFLTDDAASNLVSRYRELLDGKIADIEDQRLEKEKQRIEEAARLRDQVFQKQIDRQRANADALSVSSPLEGLAEVYNIEKQLLQKSIDDRDITLADARIRYKALEIQNAIDTRDAVEKINSTNPPSLSAFLSTNTGQDFAASSTKSLLDTLTKDVDSYISIQDSWTDAEKQRAERSNQINRKAFERNKKFNIATAVIDGLVAVNKALSSAPPPLSFIAAGLAAAAAAKTVNQIKSSTFDGGGTVSFGSSGATAGSLGSSSSSSSQTTSEANADGGGSTVYFVTQVPANLEGAINNQWLADNQRRNLKEMVDSGAVSSDAKIIVSDLPAPQLMSQNQALRSSYG